jgi:uncharacterized protein YecE (DUF72 family)
MRKTYERWAASTPNSFRFSVKLPKLITHDQRLGEPEAALDRFAEETRGLGDKFGAVLVELPPSLVFDAATAGRFFAALAQRVFVPAVCEPRHRSWFTQEADAWFAERRIGRAATDPVAAPGALDPGGWRGIAYFRLHGSPRMYYSAYEPPFMSALVRRLEAQSVPTWCIFDNAAEGAALGDALAVLEQVRTPADA